MARAHYVAHARKDNPVAKKGESYYWWAFMQGGRGGPKRYSKTQPSRSTLTQSEFYSTLWAEEDRVNALNAGSFLTVSDLESEIEEIKGNLENLKDETQGKLDNMPQGLRDGDTGQTLSARVEGLDSLISELDGLDFSEPDDEEQRKYDEGEDVDESPVETRCQSIIDEAQGFSWSID